MLEPEVTKGLAAAAAITLGLVVYLLALEQSVLDAFNQAGVEILSPRDSAVRDGNPSTVARRSGDNGA